MIYITKRDKTIQIHDRNSPTGILNEIITKCLTFPSEVPIHCDYLSRLTKGNARFQGKSFDAIEIWVQYLPTYTMNWRERLAYPFKGKIFRKRIYVTETNRLSISKIQDAIAQADTFYSERHNYDYQKTIESGNRYRVLRRLKEKVKINWTKDDDLKQNQHEPDLFDLTFGRLTDQEVTGVYQLIREMLITD